jgi:two-component system CheB/CheR fusion protein
MSATESAKQKRAGHTEAHPAKRRAPARCVVVGIGGSAGGLYAFSQLLERLPLDTGMAFVIVSHLDPAHPSLLTQLLASKSAMAVTEATDNVRLQANHVYVQPPGADITVADGHLKLAARTSKNIPHLPIDAFLQSLAAEQGQRAVGVILSGAASDGAVGLTAIKSAGGVTFAQDPASAEYPSMPSKAIATGVVDFILPPREIAAELASMAGHAYLASSGETAAIAPGQPVESEALGQIFALLRNAVGVDFSAYKLPTIRRRVARRMLLRRLDDLGAYVSYLREQPDEVEALFQDILIMVTEFFRDREAFEILRTQVIPDMLRGAAEGSTVRLWVPGCASGEEAYSLAITMLDAMAEQGISRPLKIFATDISDRDLEKARRGLYPESAVSALSAEILERYFVRSEGSYQISKTVRDLCVFARHDLTRDPPLPRLDLVSCRNVLMYMNAALQRRVVSLLHYALLPGGCLVLGRAESLGSLGELFGPIDRKHKVFVKKAGPSPALARLGFALLGGDEHAVSQLEPPGETVGARDAADRALLADFVPPGVTVDAGLEIIGFRGDTAPFLCNPPGRPTRKLLDMVSADLRDELRTALEDAKVVGSKVVRRLRIGDDASVREVDLHVVPFESKAGETDFVVLFEDISPRVAGEAKPDHPARRPSGAGESEKLRRELKATRERLEALVQEQEAANEELRAANEEILSSSEEMQSVNEELETSSEELQSTNEELESRNAELWQLSDDLNNVLVSVGLPIIMVGRDLRIRRFTPEAEHLFGVTVGDVGRPVAELAERTGIADLRLLAHEAIDGVTPLERTVRDDAGRWYAAQVRPYATADRRIDGAVLTLIDIDALTRRYKVQLRIATTLQESFIHPLPAIDGLELAAFSAPANRPELIGGDFHDIFRLPDGLVVALVGDVTGKGVKAAGLTGTVRSAVRTSALVSAAPEFILSHVNRLLRGDEGYSLLVTACVAVLDPRSGRGSLASAGHPPAVRLGEGGCALLEPRYGTPLGAFDYPYKPLAFSLDVGEALVFYTDGVTEARRAGELFGERRLLQTLREVPDRHPQVLVEHLHRAVISYAGELKDDVQILALRRVAGRR